MSPKQQKRLANRYDQYEIAAVFTETAEDFLSARLKTSWSRFLIKTLLGVILLVNGYLSHWGPWPWPKNYYLIAASIVVYHVGSYIYERASGVKSGESNLVGDYFFGAEKRGVSVRIGEDKQNYFLEVLKEPRFTETIPHTEYFTVEGYFLEEKFKRLLERFVDRVKDNKQK